MPASDQPQWPRQCFQIVPKGPSYGRVRKRPEDKQSRSRAARRPCPPHEWQLTKMKGGGERGRGWSRFAGLFKLSRKNPTPPGPLAPARGPRWCQGRGAPRGQAPEARGPAARSAPLRAPRAPLRAPARARGRPPRRLIALIRGTMPQVITLPAP